MDIFLKRYRVKKGYEYTHTSLSGGSYYIPSDMEDEFHRIYVEALRSNRVHMTEKHRDISPILIDLDFRQEDGNHIYTAEIICDILKLIGGIIVEYYDIEPNIYVMTKDVRVSKQNGIYKDGLHIVIPNVVTKPEFQYYLRKRTLPILGDILEPLRLLNGIDDIYDESVIERNNWLMYGSNKPDEDSRWEVLNLYRYKGGELVDNKIPKDKLELVEILSIRNKYDEIPLIDGKSVPMEEQIDKLDSISAKDTLESTYTCHKVDDIYVKDLVRILSDKRADNYDSWMRVGWCLHNINNSQSMLDLWIEFSKRSNKYNDGECNRFWFRMNNTGLNIGSLCKWAKEDDIIRYREVTKSSINNLIVQSVSGTHTEVARVIYRCYMDTFVCGSIRLGIWYEFKDHKWVKIDNAYSLRKNISNIIVSCYMKQATVYSDKARSVEDDDDQKKYIEKSKKILNISSKLMITSFKEGLMKECTEMFYDPDFMMKLDMNKMLIGFENGVYDLNEGVFRKGNPEDYLTISVGYEYSNVDDEGVEKDIMTFIRSIMRNEEMSEYLLKILGYMLSGDKYLEELWFFTGNGRNGKGCLCALLKATFGGYYYEPDITIVTTSKKSSSSANPEMIKAIGKRVLIASEPDDCDKDAKFKVNRLKQLRGNDLIQARALYQECVEFVPQFGMIFQMNDKPELNKVDDAIGQSLKIIEFPFQFVSSPSFPYQKVIDTTIKHKFEYDIRYRRQFMRILIRYYKEYVLGNKNIKEPEDVKEATRVYLDENNPCGEWLRTNYDITDDKKIRISSTDLRMEYERYTRSKISKDEFSKYMTLLGFTPIKTKSFRYYLGFIKKELILEDTLEE